MREGPQGPQKPQPAAEGDPRGLLESSLLSPSTQCDTPGSPSEGASCRLPRGPPTAWPGSSPCGLTHPLAEGGERVQAFLVLGGVPQLRVVTATALCEEERPRHLGNDQEQGRGKAS